MRKSIKILLIIIISVGLLVSCKSKEKVKTVEKEESTIKEGKIEYSVSEYKLPLIENRESYVFKAFKNKLYILVDYPTTESDEELNSDTRINENERLIIYDFQNETVIRTIELERNIKILDLIVDSGDIFISYEVLNFKDENTVRETTEYNPTDITSNTINRYKTKNNIARIEEDGTFKIIDENYIDRYRSKLVKINGDIYYSYENEGYLGIRKIKDDRPVDFYQFEYEVDNNIYSNTNNIFALVNESKGSYFYSIDENGEIEKAYIEGQEQLYDYNFLENGILASYTDLNDGERTKFMFINLRDERARKKIYDKEILYGFITNNTDNCLMLDTARKLHYLYIKEDRLYEVLLDEFSGNHLQLLENESTRYGLIDTDRNIYLDIYFE
ncbi:hypothetical protein [Miniphocaeibacter halophilus]|uniref:Uncharacterized protein n=1 Tax=Miniphocaeibacter halophilus TaxID=2931922 RepID=A0AC61MXL6_9FIRM|nr:hypothetical protein [Miniphocaeibacter halophilus]QQK08625.1 hypothetical protein JFY71_03535 [Miniphocaeibacter halophilus]